jgi:dihydrofolate reductase
MARNGALVSAIAAITKGDRGLGHGNDLLWKIPGDMARFRELTSGHPIIMGRKTYESIGHPLPKRTNIIVTRNPDYRNEECVVVQTIEEAVTKAKELDRERVYVIGGGEIYKAALPYTDRLYLTIVDGAAQADAFFPEYEKEFTKIVSKEKGEYKRLAYEYTTLERDI